MIRAVASQRSVLLRRRAHGGAWMRDALASFTQGERRESARGEAESARTPEGALQRG